MKSDYSELPADNQTSAAQSMINQLTTRAENMAEFIRFAMGQVQEAELSLPLKVQIKESTFEARLGTLKADNQVAYLLKLAVNGTEPL